VRLLLKAAEVQGPPTPRENIIACAKMVEAGEIDLDDFRESLLKRGLRRLVERFDMTELWKKVRGLLRYDNRVFYVDPTQHRHQRIHCTYHEVYHAIDPVHKETSDLIHLDTNETLAPWAKRKMEMEANLGSSLIRFQVDQLKQESRDFATSMETICHFAERFDASIHATLRRYVEDYDDSCIMLVFNETAEITSAGEPYYTLRYYLPSPKYEERFDHMWPEYVYPDERLFTVVNNAQPDKPSCEELALTDSSGNAVPCTAQGFHNHYDILVLIYPKPKKKPGTQVVFKTANNRNASHQLLQQPI
jgi:hypothetical protein